MQSDREQTTLGILLLGLAALAIFNFWFPGILLVLGFTMLMHGQRSWAWLLLVSGGVFWLRDVLIRVEMGGWFPLILLIAAVGLLLKVDLTRVFRRISDSQSSDSN